MPPRQSQRQRLKNKGYQQLVSEKDGTSTFSEAQARSLVKQIHAAGYLAQAVKITDYDTPSHWWVVMYRRK
jgi:hypothetical protein